MVDGLILTGLVVVGGIVGVLVARAIGCRRGWQFVVAFLLGCVFGLAALIFLVVAACCGVRVLDNQSRSADRQLNR